MRVTLVLPDHDVEHEVPMTNLYSTLAAVFESRLDSTFLRVPRSVPLTYRDKGG